MWIDQGYIATGALGLIMALVLFLPFSVKKIEEELEAFLLIMGASAATVSGIWNLHLLKEALTEPLMITAAVLAAGFIFRRFRSHVKKAMLFMQHKVGLPATAFLSVLLLGIASSVVTAIIAALILAEIAGALRLERKKEVRFIVYSCYAIGLGAALTPIGEPLSTIVVSKLKGPPHNADFWYLFSLIGGWVLPGITILSALAAFDMYNAKTGTGLQQDNIETTRHIAIRAGKVYIFVMALVLLGSGLKPLAEQTVARMSDGQLYWVNILSAVLDNATLAAAEIVPSMPHDKILFILMGLLIAGGMLIPGNIPNIISAAKLNIKSKEWAVTALPIGFVLMTGYFLLMI